MGYRRAHDNPLFGNSVTDAVIAANATWTGVNAYRNLTLGNGVDPVTIQADSMKYGPLVIRCSGLLRVRNNAVLHSDGKGAFFPGSGFWGGNRGTQSWGPGVSSLSVFSWSASGATALENAREGLVVIGAGGGGGWGTTCNGYESRPGWSMSGDWRYYSPLFTDYRVVGGQFSGQAGENGGDHIASGQDPADYILSVLSQIGVGTGGGTGGRDSEAGGISGGSSGGSLIIIARQVVIETGGIIRANGNDGADAAASNGGGGGGGSGGYIGIFTERYVNAGTVEVAGGAGGAKTGTGGVGGSGSVGCIKIERAA